MHKRYELTFLHTDGDWSWGYVETRDYHDAMLLALLRCPADARVLKVELVDLERYPAMATKPLIDTDEFVRGRNYERALTLEEAKRKA